MRKAIKNLRLLPIVLFTVFAVLLWQNILAPTTKVFAQAVTTPWNIKRDTDNSLKFSYGSSPPSLIAATNGNITTGNTFIGDVGYGATYAGFAHSSQVGQGKYALLQENTGNYTLINKAATGVGFIGFRIGNADKVIIRENGNTELIGGDLIVSAPGSAQGTIGLYSNTGALPGYPATPYPVLKTDGTYLYFAAAGQYIGYSGAGTGYVTASSKTMKDNYKDINPEDVLTKIDSLPIMEWHFKGTDQNIRHIGPFAEDFHSLFNLNGTDNKMISPTDEMGVTLVGIKALSQQVKDLQSQNAKLKQQIKEINARLDSISSK